MRCQQRHQFCHNKNNHAARGPCYWAKTRTDTMNLGREKNEVRHPFFRAT